MTGHSDVGDNEVADKKARRQSKKKYELDSNWFIFSWLLNKYNIIDSKPYY